MHGSAFFLFCGIVHIRVLDGHMFFLFLSSLILCCFRFYVHLFPQQWQGRGKNDTHGGCVVFSRLVPTL